MGWVHDERAALALTAVLLLDRTGKGVRTAPRDALISLSSASASLGTAFGLHRALDTAGAVIVSSGPRTFSVDPGAR